MEIPQARPEEGQPGRLSEQEEESKKLRRLQMMMNMVMSVICQDSDLTIEEASELAANAKRAALAMFQPDLMVYVAGADPFQDDQLGGLSLTLEGLKQRDSLVLSTARGKGIPVAIVSEPHLSGLRSAAYGITLLSRPTYWRIVFPFVEAP